MIINEEKFLQDLMEFVEKWNRICTNMNPWIIHKNNLGTWADQRSVLEKFVRVCSITFNPVYGVPVLWFNLYDSDGKRINLDYENDHSNLQELNMSKNLITENEHPCLGMAFYNLHPCHTEELLNILHAENNYLMVFCCPFLRVTPSAAVEFLQRTMRSIRLFIRDFRLFVFLKEFKDNDFFT